MTGLHTILAKLYQSKRGNVKQQERRIKKVLRKVYVNQHCSSRKRGTVSKLCQPQKMISAQKRLLPKLQLIKEKMKKGIKKSIWVTTLKRCLC